MKYAIDVENTEDLLAIRDLRDAGFDYLAIMRKTIQEADARVRAYASLLAQERRSERALDESEVQARIKLLTPPPLDDEYPFRLSRDEIEALARRQLRQENRERLAARALGETSKKTPCKKNRSPGSSHK